MRRPWNLLKPSKDNTERSASTLRKTSSPSLPKDRCERPSPNRKTLAETWKHSSLRWGNDTREGCTVPYPDCENHWRSSSRVGEYTSSCRPVKGTRRPLSATNRGKQTARARAKHVALQHCRTTPPTQPTHGTIETP